ncbi:MAG: hypothetical protein HS102_19035 [Planctomycetia bacterium]|nr:hypothetical protein [Planctomycetia bacterium]
MGGCGWVARYWIVGDAYAAGDRTWVSNTSTDKANWFNDTNWSPSIVPTSSDHAIIPASLSGSREMPVIYSSDGSQIAYAQKITVNASGSDIGTLDIYGATRCSFSATAPPGPRPFMGSSGSASTGRARTRP